MEERRVPTKVARRPERRSVSRVPSLYVGGVILAGAVVLVLAVLRAVGHDPTGGEPAVFLVLAALLVIGELRPLRLVDRRFGGEITVTWSFAFGLALLVPLGVALSMLALASAVGDLANRKPARRVAFNSAQLVVSLAIGAGVLDLFGARLALTRDVGPAAWWLPVAVLAGATVYVVNGALVGVVVALHQQLPVGGMVRTTVIENFTTDGLLLALAPVYVSVARDDLVLFPFVLLTAVAVVVTAKVAMLRQHEATHDQLTGLPNRRVLFDQLATFAAWAAEGRERIAVLLVDLDGFKEINDRLGHRIGDIVLQEVARRLHGVTRPIDVVGRLGGDEFAVVLRRIVSPADTEAVARRIAAALHEPCMVDGFPVMLGASVGAAIAPEHGDDAETLIERADIAMYSAKRERVLFAIYEPHEESGPARVTMLAELHNAVERGELLIGYQPIIELATGRPTGIEALLRWEHPRWGAIGPNNFMPLAEQTDLVSPITRHVLARALAQAADWRRAGHDLVVAVNGSARNVLDLDLPDHVAALLDEAGVPPSMLELEISENAMLGDPTRVRVVLRALQDLGVRLAIDDFGTGYSSLLNLRDLPVDRVKIDRAFVHDLRTPRGARVIGPIIQLAHNLGVETVADGVEDIVTLSELRELGCDHAQGSAIAMPMEAADATSWLAGPTVILPSS